MIRRIKFVLLASALLALPMMAPAQTRTAPMHFAGRPMRMMQPPAARIVAPARRVVARMPMAPPVNHTGSAATMNGASNISVSPNGTIAIISSPTTSFDLNQLLNNTPGLGFDFSHVAALNGNLGERAFIDPVTQQDIALAEQLARSTPAVTTGFIPFWGGYGGYSQPVVEEQQPQQQPQVIVLQEPAPPSAPAASAAPTVEAANSEQAPLPDVGEFTLVLHDGTKIKAVAFTRQSDRLVYITSKEVRDSFPVSELDVSATQQINQQHGTPLHLSL